MSASAQQQCAVQHEHAEQLRHVLSFMALIGTELNNQRLHSQRGVQQGNTAALKQCPTPEQAGGECNACGVCTVAGTTPGDAARGRAKTWVRRCMLARFARPLQRSGGTAVGVQRGPTSSIASDRAASGHRSPMPLPCALGGAHDGRCGTAKAACIVSAQARGRQATRRRRPSERRRR